MIHLEVRWILCVVFMETVDFLITEIHRHPDSDSGIHDRAHGLMTVQNHPGKIEPETAASGFTAAGCFYPVKGFKEAGE